MRSRASASACAMARPARRRSSSPARPPAGCCACRWPRCTTRRPGAGAPGGLVLMLDDMTRDFEQEALRDRLLLGLTEGSRASHGNMQAAVEMLELPDLEAPMRERF